MIPENGGKTENRNSFMCLEEFPEGHLSHYEFGNRVPCKILQEKKLLRGYSRFLDKELCRIPEACFPQLPSVHLYVSGFVPTISVCG